MPFLEQRAANTGWGAQDKEPRWGHDMYDGPQNGKKESGEGSKEYPARPVGTDISRSRGTIYHSSTTYEELHGHGKEPKRFGRHGDDDGDPKSKGRFDRTDDLKSRKRRKEDDELDHRHRDSDRRDDRRTDRYRDDGNGGRPIERRESREEYRSRRDDGGGSVSRSRGDRDASEGKRLKRHESESYAEEDRDGKREERSSAHGRESSSHRH